MILLPFAKILNSNKVGIVFVVLQQTTNGIMKTILQFIIAISAIAFLSCTKETVGPQGPQGPVGAQGESAYVFEVSNIDFIGPEYEVFVDFPEDFQALESDVALAYLLWDVTTDGDGNQLEVWRQLPQTVYTELGQINYNFDFTMIDLRLFLTTEFDPANLEPVDTDDWILRTVIIPGNFWGSRTAIDHSDYQAVKEAYGLPDLPVKTIKKRRK